MVTIHMVASLDGFVAKRDGSVGWMEVPDTFDGGEAMTTEAVAAFLQTIDCYVMGSHTYETALALEAQGLGWAYGDTPVTVLTHRTLPKNRNSIDFYSGDLRHLVTGLLAPRFANIWFVGGAQVAADCLRLGLADEVRYSILPVVIGDGIPFFNGIVKDVPLHLLEAKAYNTGMVALRYQVRE